jgi:hypothetical protein
MLSTELKYLCTGLKCFPDGWNAFYSVGMVSTELECFLSVGIHFYRVEMLSGGLECFRQIWNTFAQSWNAL